MWYETPEGWVLFLGRWVVIYAVADSMTEADDQLCDGGCPSRGVVARTIFWSVREMQLPTFNLQARFEQYSCNER